LKKDLWGGEFWSDGYYVATVATSGSWDTLVQYVKNQGQQPDVVNLQLLFPTDVGFDNPGEK
jgi:putative transposase